LPPGWQRTYLKGPRTVSRLRMRILWMTWRKGKVAAKLPEVGQRKDRRHQHLRPQPRALDKAPLWTADQNAEQAKSDRVFDLKPDASDHCKNQNQYRGSVTVHRAHHAPHATHPKEWLEGIHGTPVVHDEVNRNRDFRITRTVLEQSGSRPFPASTGPLIQTSAAPARAGSRRSPQR
jgi:hypothetical protein